MTYVQGNNNYGVYYKTPTMVEALECHFLENREALLGEDGIICTPLKVLKDLAMGSGDRIDAKTYEIHLVGKSGPDETCHRVTVKVGNHEGHGEASRHRLALQLAAADLLEKMKADGLPVPSYGLLPGCRTNPMIYRDLKELCNMKTLAGPPVYSQVQVPEGQVGNFAFECRIGLAKTTGVSDSLFLAKRNAARKMYEILANEQYPNDRIATGSGCVRIEDMLEMGIPLVESTRAIQRKAMDVNSTPDGPQKLNRRSSKGDLFDDDFAEEEDDVLMVREQMKDLTLSYTIHNQNAM